MKRSGIMNAQLAGRLAALGHTQSFAVADVGLPVPARVPIVDLAIIQGLPRFVDVLDAVLAEVVVEAHTFAEEAQDLPSGELLASRGDQLGKASLVPHEDLKARIDDCAFVIRTGEATPYANVILQCGVPF